MDFEVRRELRRTRVRTYKIALLIGLLGAVPVYLVKDIAPWSIAIPILSGVIIKIVVDWRETSKKRLLNVASDFLAIEVSESLYLVPRPVVRVGDVTILGSVPMDAVREKERFEAQARETNQSRARLDPCYV